MMCQILEVGKIFLRSLCVASANGKGRLMEAFKRKIPNRCQLYLTCIISLVVLIIYSGLTLTRKVSVERPPACRIMNTVFPNEEHPPEKNASMPCFKDAFKDILLVIVFNFPFYESIPHLTALYKPAFPHLIFCGPPHNTTRRSILTVDIIKGYLGYKCLARAIREHPGYKGYFYISDDVILKYWNFPDLKRDKLWESFRIIASPASGPASNAWPWWNTPYGLKNCRRALNDVAKMTLKEKKLDGTHLLNTLLKNSDGALLCYGSRSDVLYVRQKHATAFSILSETFYKQKVFLEIAVPTIFRLLEQKENIARIPGEYIIGNPQKSDSRVFWYIYLSHKEYYFMHPFKLHRGGTDSNFNLAMMNFMFIDKIKALTNCTPTLL